MRAAVGPTGLCPCVALIWRQDLANNCLEHKLLSLPRADSLAMLDLFRRTDASKAGSSSSEQVTDAELVSKDARLCVIAAPGMPGNKTRCTIVPGSQQRVQVRLGLSADTQADQQRDLSAAFKDCSQVEGF